MLKEHHSATALLRDQQAVVLQAGCRVWINRTQLVMTEAQVLGWMMLIMGTTVKTLFS